ncbi:tetratricopeptide repeat protein [Treponema sp. OMZ 840]|uniref:tetratricopeptide repeat protein n=1 Tax=Treponema sp. OMZ 840 TaxID=244313 RepID=UPI003D8C48F9
MNPAHPLDSVIFISLPDNFELPAHAFKLDTTIPLPVQKAAAAADFDPSTLTQEQIFAGILTVLAYESANPHVQYYRSLIKAAKPDITRELTEAAILKAKNEDYEIADEIFAALRGLEPDNPAVILNSALFFDQRADSYRRSGLTEDADAYDESAYRYYKQAMEAEPAVPDAFFNAGFFYLKQKNFGKAKLCFETYLTLTDQSDSEQDENTAYKRERAGQISSDIGSRNLDDELFKSAFDFISMGQEEKGLDCIRRFLEKNPKVWNAWFMLGWGLRRLNRWQDAKAAFEQSISCGGENSDIYNELSLCLMELNDYATAGKYLHKALKLEPENTKIMSNMGFLALKKGDTEEACRYFTAVLEFDPDDRIAQETLAKLKD